MTNHSQSVARGNRIKAFPVSWITTGKSLLIVGGCLAELCRIRHALRFDWAGIRVVVPAEAKPLCAECRSDPRVVASPGEASEQDVAACDFAVEASSDAHRTGRLAAWCRARRVPLNAMDKLEFCDVYYNALVFREPLVLAISSGGESPALSAALRRWLERHVGPGWGHAAAQLAELRNRLPATPARSELLRSLAADEGFLGMIARDDVRAMEQRIQDAYDRFRTGA